MKDTALEDTALELQSVGHRFGDTRVLNGIDFTVSRGEVHCVVGSSGCGKTTILRLIAGLERLQTGRMRIGSLDVSADVEPPPEDRDIGLLFQDFALFPHMSVRENVAFGLTGESGGETERRVREALSLVGMTGYGDAYPHMLSGGQQQRVALARAMAPRPGLLLLDEPFSGLDSGLRAKVRDDTLHVLQATGMTALLVTHDPEEAMFMADMISVIRDGRVAQCAQPDEIYQNPADSFVAAFFSDVNRIHGTVENGAVHTLFGPISANGLSEGASAEVIIRQEALRTGEHIGAAAEPATQVVRARVIMARLLGRSSIIHLSAPDPSGGALHLHSRMPGKCLPAPNEWVDIVLDLSQAFVFPASVAK